MAVVRHLLVAEFDVDLGSVIRQQYPCDTGHSEQSLAEMMLPDGVHRRSEDWTVFLLNRPQLPRVTAAAGKRAGQDSSDDQADDGVLVSKPVQAFIFACQGTSGGEEWRHVGAGVTHLCWDAASLTLSAVEVDTHDVVMEVSLRKAAASALDTTAASSPSPSPPPDPTAAIFARDEPRFHVMLPLRDGAPVYGFKFPDADAEDVYTEVLLPQIRANLTLPPPGASPSAASPSSALPTSPTSPAADSGTDGADSPSSTEPSSPRMEQRRRAAPPTPQLSVRSCDDGVEASRRDSSDTHAFLHCLSLVRTLADKSIKRGARVIALALCTPSPAFQMYRPVLQVALTRYVAAEDKRACLAELFDALNTWTLPPIRVPSNPYDLRSTAVTRVSVAYAAQTFRLDVPVSLWRGEVGGVDVAPFLRKYRDASLVVINALMQQRRVLFTGYHTAVDQVCTDVLAAMMLPSPPLRGFLARSFPYTSLQGIAFLGVPGYIAGVTNPVFESRPDWWDVLCDVETGKTVVSSALVDTAPGLLAPSDEQRRWFRRVLDCAERADATAEQEVRQALQRWMQDYADEACGDAVFPDDATARQQLERHFSETVAWKTTLSYELYLVDRQARRQARRITRFDADHHVRMLRTRRYLPDSVTRGLLQDLVEEVVSDAEKQAELIALLPVHFGGVYPIASRLLHRDPLVRQYATQLLRVFDHLEQGKSLISALNMFLLLTYARCQRQLPVDKDGVASTTPAAAAASATS